MKSFSKCAAVLAGGLVFAGYASGASFSEDFESATGTGSGGPHGQLGGGTGGGWGAYGTSDDYSGTGGDHSTVVTGGGSFYGHTVGVTPNPVSDAIAIDAGHTEIYLEAWVANFTGDTDHTLIGILQYSDAAGTVQVGGPLADIIVDDSANASTNSWNFQSGTVAVEAGAISYRVVFGGVGNDTYADNIFAESRVPEPGSLALLALGGLMVARRRRG